jgi:hypothetical protein
MITTAAAIPMKQYNMRWRTNATYRALNCHAGHNGRGLRRLVVPSTTVRQIHEKVQTNANA